MSDQVPPPPPPGPPTGAPYGAPAQGVPRPGELMDRFLARLIDGVGLAVISFVIQIAILANIFVDESTYFGVTVEHGYTYPYYLLSGLISAALWLGYNVLMETSQGATFGKQIMKLKVYGPDGVSKPTMQQSVMRNIWTTYAVLGVLGSVGSTIGAVIGLVAVIVIAVQINSNAPSRRHFFDDLAGGTQVMKVG